MLLLLPPSLQPTLLSLFPIIPPPCPLSCSWSVCCGCTCFVYMLCRVYPWFAECAHAVLCCSCCACSRCAVYAHAVLCMLTLCCVCSCCAVCAHAVLCVMVLGDCILLALDHSRAGQWVPPYVWFKCAEHTVAIAMPYSAQRHRFTPAFSTQLCTALWPM